MPTLRFTRDDESEVEIEYTCAPYIAATPASLDYPGDPAEGGEIEDFEARDAEGRTVTLSDDEQARAEAAIYDLPPDDDYPDFDDY